MNRHDEGRYAASSANYGPPTPDGVITTTRGRSGPRLTAYRPASTFGLYAVITADPAELRHELDAAYPHPAAPLRLPARTSARPAPDQPRDTESQPG